MSVPKDQRPIEDGVVTRCVPVYKIISLRHRILRQGLPVETARFPGDDDSMTQHIATFLAEAGGQAIGEPICCASFMRGELNGEKAWQLRGMATDVPYQGRQLGTRLLIWFEQAIIDRGPLRLMWCNARLPAVKFYESNGWECISEVFDIPTAGPHCKMMKRA